jgi:chorismate mutase
MSEETDTAGDPDETTADRTVETAETAERDPGGRDLEALRQEIHEIDRELVELIARRTYVADTIAAVKAEQGLPTTDEKQETRVMERAGANAERFEVDANLVKAIFRLLIELNKVEQREQR